MSSSFRSPAMVRFFCCKCETNAIRAIRKNGNDHKAKALSPSRSRFVHCEELKFKTLLICSRRLPFTPEQAL